MCIDQKEIFAFMQENEIGTELALFYMNYSTMLERKRNFALANKMLLLGQSIKARPLGTIESAIEGFKNRMSERIDRDFTSRNKSIENDDTIDVSIMLQDDSSNIEDHSHMSSSTAREPSKLKRKCPYDNGHQYSKRVKVRDLIKGKE
jgi:Mad3/BUB1 homology region 1